MWRKLKVWSAVLLFSVLLSGYSYAEGPVKPKPKDKCPVCGMFVAPYPQWTAEIIFKDGTYAVFDGPKDMFKYYFNVSKYNKEKTDKEISGIYVTEYYTTKIMSAKDVYFVQGSDVMGPMGKEFIPVKGEEEAGTFMRDHRGKKLFKFDEITLADIPR
jgi:nitrous oxide reductase accessory protein NosL